MEEQIQLCNRILGTDEDGIGRAVDSWQSGIREEENHKRAVKRKEWWDMMMSLIPPEPDDFMEWAASEGTIEDNFIFYRKEGKEYTGYCTNCGKTFRREAKMEHNSGDKRNWQYKGYFRAMCPNCRHMIDTKAWGKQKTLKTLSQVVLPQLAGEYISFQTFLVHKTFTRKDFPDRWEQKVEIYENNRIFADPKTFESRDSFVIDTVTQLGQIRCWRSKWYKDYAGINHPGDVTSGRMYQRNADDICRASGMQKKLYEHCEGGPARSPQRELVRMCKRKYIEYMLKAGLTKLADESMEYHELPFKKESKDAKNLKQLLGIDGQMLRMMKDINGKFFMVDNLRMIRERGEKVDVETIMFINEEGIKLQMLPLKDTGMTIQRTMNYIRKQAEKEKRGFGQVLAEYRDYIHLAQQMELDTTDEIICRTPDLKTMHDRYSDELKARKAEIRRQTCEMKFPNIYIESEKNEKHFHYEKEDLVVMAAQSAAEIITEGQKQHHCVGASDGYMDKMNRGVSYILFLRKKEDRTAPYYTLEVTWGGDVIQSYGAFDRRPDEKKIDKWLESFSREIKKRADREKAKEPERILIAAG